MKLTLSFLALTALFGAAQAASQDETPDPRKAAIAAIEEAGGLVRKVAQDSTDLSVNFAVHGKEAGDAVLAQLVHLPETTQLNLGGTKVTDAGMLHVAGLARLERLYLFKSGVTDAGLKGLTELAELRYLNLYGTAITDAGLAHVQALAKLEKVYLWDSKVTEEGVKRLSEARPKLAVHYFIATKPVLAPDATCCDKAAAAGGACDHPCCVAATAAGGICFKCNPKKAETCCEKASAGDTTCEHPCCIAATAAGRVCFKCNPKKAETCCEKAEADSSECTHPCCIAAAKEGKVCEKCNPPKD